MQTQRSCVHRVILRGMTAREMGAGGVKLFIRKTPRRKGK